MVDKVFDIQDLLLEKSAKLVIPPLRDGPVSLSVKDNQLRILQKPEYT